MIEPDVFVERMAELADRFNRPLHEATQRRYYELLNRELTTEEFVAAAELAFRNSSFWPSPGELIQFIHPPGISGSRRRSRSTRCWPWVNHTRPAHVGCGRRSSRSWASHCCRIQCDRCARPAAQHHDRRPAVGTARIHRCLQSVSGRFQSRDRSSRSAQVPTATADDRGAHGMTEFELPRLIREVDRTRGEYLACSRRGAKAVLEALSAGARELQRRARAREQDFRQAAMSRVRLQHGDADEIREEAERRRVAKAGWNGEAPMTPEQQRRKDMLLERDVQQRVIKLYVAARLQGARLLAAAESEIHDARRRRSAGVLADHRAGTVERGSPRVMWYHETKKPKDGRYSDEQLLFAADCREAGIDVIGGGVPEAIAQLAHLNLPAR
jgi:hypothetical protein